MTRSADVQPDLFDEAGIGDVGLRLLANDVRWPEPNRFPLNLAGRAVRDEVLADLAASRRPLVVAGYASLARLVDWLSDDAIAGVECARILLGHEPFESQRENFALAGRRFPEAVRKYWLARGISLHRSARIVVALERIDSGLVQARFVDDERRPLHAKIYAGEAAVTIGSSNFTDAGLCGQIEANVRFEAGRERRRFREASTIAEAYWDAGTDYLDELRALLEQLLRVVSWQEALARACAQLLEGEWAQEYLRSDALDAPALWPSQKAGIAQALWVLENVGSVLVADPTGSGKTRMGANLLRALRDRTVNAGRMRGDAAVMICPPALARPWQSEASACGLSLSVDSHGLLSLRQGERYEAIAQAMRRAQTLAIDEAHNFLNLRSQRSQEVLAHVADHVVLFTATPINRGAADLLSLVDMLGADNLEEDALVVLEKLARRKGDAEGALGPSDVDALRREIQRFTVRRTRTALNALVDRAPAEYVDAHGNPCRYPRHVSRTYPTGETAEDRALASRIRELAEQLLGLALLEDTIEMPEALAAEGWNDDRFLRGRLSATRHLALHNVMATLRSSRAALVEHLLGTVHAAQRLGLDARIKPVETGNTIGKLRERGLGARPGCRLACALPNWLVDDETWRAACAEEIDRYEAIANLVGAMSDARERTKAQHLRALACSHRLVLAFDSRLISLEVMRTLLPQAGDVQVIVATGSDAVARSRVRKAFARSSAARAIALCSDSMSEGVNLQGASAVVHLDMPSVVRIAEQRVGRVDRMDSLHREIEAWWPDDSPEFAIRADERFVQRYQTVQTLLGANLPLPDSLERRAEAVSADEIIREAEEAAQLEPWDGIHDAFAAVRDLVDGEAALMPPSIYERYRTADLPVLSRVSLVRSHTPWAFFSIAGPRHGAPRWVYVEVGSTRVVRNRLDEICASLRARLGGEVENLVMDASTVPWIDRFLREIALRERRLLPKKKQRALEQMDAVLASYVQVARRRGAEREALRWQTLRAACASADDGARHDLDAVAEQWIRLVRPAWFARLAAGRRRRRPLLLRDLRADLLARPLDLVTVEDAFSDIPRVAPLAERVGACILGVPV